MNSEPLVLGIDAGTGGVRACLFDLRGGLAAAAERPYPTFFRDRAGRRNGLRIGGMLSARRRVKRSAAPGSKRDASSELQSMRRATSFLTDAGGPLAIDADVDGSPGCRTRAPLDRDAQFGLTLLRRCSTRRVAAS